MSTPTSEFWPWLATDGYQLSFCKAVTSCCSRILSHASYLQSNIPPTSPGWFMPPISGDESLQVDGRVLPPFWGPPSPPRGLLYPAPYHFHRPHIPMPSAHLNGHEIQRVCPEVSGGDERHPPTASYHTSLGPCQPAFSPVPENIKRYSMAPVPDVGTYYLTPSPEPFMEYAFAFESGHRANHGLVRYPMVPHSGQQFEHNHYPQPLLPYPPLPPNSIPVIEQRIGQPEISVQMPRTPPQYVIPPGHLVVSPPPGPAAHAAIFSEPLNSCVSYSLQVSFLFGFRLIPLIRAACCAG